MCGIGAIIGIESIKQDDVIKLMSPIKTRGESFNEHVILKTAVLACNRLKIVDRDQAKQPIFNEKRNIFAVFNGEIYNYKKLKLELEQLGHIFITNSDTEVLVHGYEEWKTDLPKKLDGQFAFVIYDKTTNEFIAARDPYGIKPLFYAKHINKFYFASEIKQLISFVGSINQLEPGHLITNQGKDRYYYLPHEDIETIKLNIKQLFDKAVKKRVQTDLPIAVFLSGGIDSTAVLAIARKHHKNVTAIIVGNIWESNDSDAKYAIKYCKENNIKYKHFIPPDENELFNLVPEIIKITESFEPNMVKQSVLSYYIAKIAKESGFKIALCGEGADEIFAGYPEFTNIDVININELAINFFKNLYRTQLQRVDKTSMHHTVEVRTPFLDFNLVNYCLELPGDLKVKNNVTKWILRESLNGMLPDYILYRKKIVLSEGMGHKGNSLTKGMFTEIISNLVTDEELDTYKKKYPKLNITTKEEVYYFKLYCSFGYDKLILDTRPVVNKIHSAGK